MQHVQYLHLMHDRVHVYAQNWQLYDVEQFFFVHKPMLNVTSLVLVHLYNFVNSSFNVTMLNAVLKTKINCMLQIFHCVAVPNSQPPTLFTEPWGVPYVDMLQKIMEMTTNIFSNFKI